ncbi:MAG TPA: AMP-binding protein [Thermoanaerobaculia bacterium]|nr:AMP-binding protein [Thermoanaerobaculia bacterium]
MTATTPTDTLLAALDRAATQSAAPLSAGAPPAGDLPRAGLRFVERDESASFLAWPEIRRRAHAVAAGLAALGVAPGQRVGLVFPTGPEFFDAFFGTLAVGAVPVPLYPPVRLGRLGEYHRRTAGMIAAAGARLVLADARVRRLLGETVVRARPPLGCRTLAGVVEDGGPGRGDGAAPAVEVRPDDLALVQFSSGTTVDPKPVALTHRALLAQAEALNSLWPGLLADRPTGVSWLPLYHDMGLIGCVLPALLLPSELTLLGPELFVARPALWLRTISRYRATVSPAPNFAYSLAVHRVRDEELDGVDLSCWRVALNGAEAVAPAVLAAFRDRFARWGLPREALTPVYGLSEAALAVTFSALDRPFTTGRFDREALAADGEARPVADDGRDAGGEPGGVAEAPAVELVSVGRPLPGFDVAVLPDTGDREDDASLPPSPAEGSPLPEGQVGRVWVRGPSLMAGYLGLPEQTARTLRGGWLDTGDLGFCWRGELYLTGRAKDVLILRGRNHAPQDLERAAGEVAGARRGCAVAVSWLPEGAEGERLVLFVESAAPAPPSERRRLAAECARAARGATGLAVDEVVVLAPGTLPRTSSGKLRRRETLARHLAGTLLPPEPVNALRLAGALTRSGLAFARHAVRTRRRATGEEP